MNVTKNALIEALKYLNEYPKSSLKKDEIIDIFNKMFNEKNINNFVRIINHNIYKILSQLEQAESGIYIDKKYKKDVDFLKNTLIIEETDNEEDKLYIEFTNGMKGNFANFINSKNEKKVKYNQKIVDLIINIMGTYGIMQIYYELSTILDNLLNDEIDIELLLELIDYNIDLRRKTAIATDNRNEMYLMYNSIYCPQEIMNERRKRNLEYKSYSIEELENKNIDSLINCTEAKRLIEFLRNIKYENPKGLVGAIIYDIMISPQIEIKKITNVEGLKFEDINQANEYLQLAMDLHNNIPHFSLCGYSPNDLMHMQIQEMHEQQKEKFKNKIGRNELCPCGSGKKYKNCCMNKVISVEFSKEKHDDCVEEDDAKMFFALKNLLFDYTNKKYHINKELEDFTDICDAFPEEIIDIRKKLWEDKSIIDEYIKENPDELNKEFIETIKQWNEKKINKAFTLYKYEEEYAVFMDDNYIYYVKGIKDRIRDMIPENSLPMFVETVLLPLKNQIIYDSYIQQYSISFGKNMRKEMDKAYRDLIKNKKVKYEL